LRRLAQRIEVTTFTAFIAALVQAEQVGGGVASGACGGRRTTCATGGASSS